MLMKIRKRPHFIALAVFFLLQPLFVTKAGEPDAIAKPDEFPASGEPLALSGELTMVDHVNRMGILRPDRNDKHNKYHWDLPHHFTMLPYGMAFRCGSPATLGDLPLRTHLHGLFFLGQEGDYKVPLLHTEYAQKVANDPNQFSPDSPWNQVLRLEDDFSLYQRQGVVWKILSMDSITWKLVAERIDPEPAPTKAEGLTGKQTFDFTEATRIWVGTGIGELDDLKVGQKVLFNLEWATLYGAGRLTDVWVDVQARETAGKLQNRTFLQHLRDRGFPARIDHVEHLGAAKGEVTASFYQGPRPVDFKLFKANTSGRLAVVEQNLRTYHDAGLGIRFLEVLHTGNPPPGHSGVSVKFHVGELLEGIRPGRSVRLLPNGWLPQVLPREERLAPFDIRPLFLEADPQETGKHPQRL